MVTVFDPPDHVKKLIDNLKEVRILAAIHKAMSGGKVGKPIPDVEVVNKSAIVLLVACWEAFVEDLAKRAFDHMLQNAPEPKVFPDRVLGLASKDMRADKDETKVWVLAGSGWQQVLLDHRTSVLEQYVGTFHTPRPKQVDGLFRSLIGLTELSATWRWKGMSNKQAEDKLERLVTRRGAIAHRVKDEDYVRKQEVVAAANFIQRVAAISSNRVSSYVKSRLGAQPWKPVRFGKTS